VSVSFISRLLGATPRADLGGNPLDDRYYQTSGGFISRAGVRVSEDTALAIATVYRCVSILSNMLAMFPKGMFEKQARGRKEAGDHPLDPVISFKPNQRQTAFEFWRLVCFHLVLRQNAFVQIVPGLPGRGWVGQLVPLNPDRVKGPEELPSGKLRYEYTRGDGRKFTLIGGQDIWHLTGLSSDGLRGMSLLELAADSFGGAIAAERHAARFFERGVKFSGILEHPRTLKPETASAMSDSFGRKYGGEQGAGRVPVLWEGMTFRSVGMSHKDAEFMDSRRFSIPEIARWFGVPPHMVGDVERSTSWGTGIEQQGLQFLIYSLLPWIGLIEQSILFWLVVQPERFYPKMNVNAILRMDAQAQASVFSTLIDKGVLSPNECRELLERNPRDGGDEYVDPGKAQAPPRPNPAPPRPTEEPGEQDEDENQKARATERVRKIEKARAEELLHEEDDALCRMAKEHAKDTQAWRSSVAGFYGRFAQRIASTGIAELEEARAWCAGRRDLVLADGGLLKLTEGHPASNGALLGGLHAEG
jgi:HK97 family phage portal protein